MVQAIEATIALSASGCCRFAITGPAFKQAALPLPYSSPFLGHSDREVPFQYFEVRDAEPTRYLPGAFIR